MHASVFFVPVGLEDVCWVEGGEWGVVRRSTVISSSRVYGLFLSYLLSYWLYLTFICVFIIVFLLQSQTQMK